MGKEADKISSRIKCKRHGSNGIEESMIALRSAPSLKLWPIKKGIEWFVKKSLHFSLDLCNAGHAQLFSSTQMSRLLQC
jgi:hypothetical protein